MVIPVGAIWTGQGGVAGMDRGEWWTVRWLGRHIGVGPCCFPLSSILVQ